MLYSRDAGTVLVNVVDRRVSPTFSLGGDIHRRLKIYRRNTIPVSGAAERRVR